MADEATEKPIIRDELGRLAKGTAGKPFGAQNKLNRTVKETVLAVFNELQGDPQTSLKSFAVAFPRDFYAIAAKLIPTEITGSIRQVIVVTDTEQETELNEPG